MTDARAQLRQRLRDARTATAPSARIAAAAELATRLLAFDAVRRARSIAGYWAVGGEMPLHSLVTRLDAGTRYCLPVLQPDRTLRFAPWRVGDAVEANRYGIPEPTEAVVALAPSEIDVVLLPLVGFTRTGHRLGMGGGWYDRSFAFRHLQPAPPLLVGVGFAAQQVDDCDVQPWDVPLDALATERELLVFRGRGPA